MGNGLPMGFCFLNGYSYYKTDKNLPKSDRKGPLSSISRLERRAFGPVAWRGTAVDHEKHHEFFGDEFGQTTGATFSFLPSWSLLSRSIDQVQPLWSLQFSSQTMSNSLSEFQHWKWVWQFRGKPPNSMINHQFSLCKIAISLGSCGKPNIFYCPANQP